MKKLELILGILLVVLIGAIMFENSEPIVISPGVSEEKVETQAPVRDLTYLKEDFKLHMAENYGQTSWYKDMLSFDIVETDGKVMLGIAMTKEDSYKDFEMPVTMWIDYDSSIKIDTLIFIVDSKIVQRREF